MKRSEAANKLAEFLVKHIEPLTTSGEGEIEILPILDFLENEIGMSAPLRDVMKRLPLKERSWEPETSDREREFQSKKDSCI